MWESEIVLKVLAEVEAAAKDATALEIGAAARRQGLEVDVFERALRASERYGLALLDESHPLFPPLLIRAGRQFMDCGGAVDDQALDFLPLVIDNLHARRALLEAGGVVADLFRQAILTGCAVEWAQDVVPPAFAPAIGEREALDLYAATVALMARLSAGRPAGCVGEEIVAVDLTAWAEVVLDSWVQLGELEPDDAIEAARELQNLFELFQDDDVLRMFDMEEPSDAAVALYSDVDGRLGVADQRLEAWFRPFSWAAPTGYLQPVEN